MPGKEKEWQSGVAGAKYPGRVERERREKQENEERREAKSTPAGDAPPIDEKDDHKKKKSKKGKDKGVDASTGSEEAETTTEGYSSKDEKSKRKEKDKKGKKSSSDGTGEESEKEKGGKKGKKGKETEVKKGAEVSKTKKDVETEADIPYVLTSSDEGPEVGGRKGAMKKRPSSHRWPFVTKVPIRTKPWQPPGPPEKPPKVVIALPKLVLKKWIPPWMMSREPRPKLPRTALAQITQPLPYEGSMLKKIWHHFSQVDLNKMMLQGTTACDTRRYCYYLRGAQTGCIALVCRALLDEKSPAQLVKRDVDDVINAGDYFYKQCLKNHECYKGNPALELAQLLRVFYFRETRYVVNTSPRAEGVLVNDADSHGSAQPDLMSIMEEEIGQSYMYILTVGKRQHFLIWGHPPEDGDTQVKTVCYIFDPYMLDHYGTRNITNGSAAFLRYPGVTSFVIDFLMNHGNLQQAQPKPSITLTNIEIEKKERMWRRPGFEIDLQTFKTHCQNEWLALQKNALIDQKRYQKKWNLTSMSAESVAMSRKSSRKKVRDYIEAELQHRKARTEPLVVVPPPVAPERAPAAITADQLMELKGENFFLHCPRTDAHTFGRDDWIPLAEEEVVVHSPVAIADKTYKSQFDQLEVEKWVLRGTRHFASYRYQSFKSYTGVACCVAALAMLRRHRARAWNEDMVDETFDVGYNLFRDSLMVRRGPIRRLVLGELKSTFSMRDKQYKFKKRNIVVWGKLISHSPTVYNLCRGIETFFKQSDSGILQIPGELETALWYEGGKYYLYHPWPADKYGNRVGLQEGGKGCLLSFTRISRLCEHFLDNTKDLKRKPFSISDVSVWDLGSRPEPVNSMKAVGPNRWIVRGSFHEGDERFPEQHRNKQATPTAIAAIAMASLLDPAEWTEADIDDTLIRGDILYEKTIENLEKLGINLEIPASGEEGEDEEEEGGARGAAGAGGASGTLAAADVLSRFTVTDSDSIETEVQDSAFSGLLNAEPGSGVMSLKESLKAMFKDNKAAVVTARGGSVAVWNHDNHLYFFDPHGCDENGLPSEEPLSGACLIRMKNNVKELADVIMGNLAPGSDDSFNISPVEIIQAKINKETGAPEIKPEGKAFEWLNKNTATILMGPRGENTAIGEAAKKCNVSPEDTAGRDVALPVVAAFCAATAAVPPPGMHQEHMFNFLEAGAEYYLNHVKTTGRKDININDLSQKFEMGVNTFSIEVGDPTTLPLRLPDEVVGEGGGGAEEETALDLEGEQMEEKDDIKEMKELLFRMWYDTSKPTTVSLLCGDYHQLGVWMTAGGKVVAFDPAPTLAKGLLTGHRIRKGDELRMDRLKGEVVDEGAEEAEDEEAGGEGEAQPEPEPEPVPPESCPVLMIFASPGEFIDKLVAKGGLDPKQALAPYKLYPVSVTNELTSAVKGPRAPPRGDDEAEDEAEEVESQVEALEDTALGTHFERKTRTVASLRGFVAQNEAYFMEDPNRDNQDAANVIMGMIVHHIEPYEHWKPALVDAILKYGDRLYSLSIPYAKHPPRLTPVEVINEFHVTNFNVKTEVAADVVTGDYKASETAGPLSLKKGLKKFFEKDKFAVICAKNYCAGVWRARDNKAWVYWDTHPVGPTGKLSPVSAAGLVLFSTLDELADTFKINLNNLSRPGTNDYSISSVRVLWEFSATPQPVTLQGAVPDEGYEWKVLTAFVEMARGRTMLRGNPAVDLPRFCRDSLVASAPTAIVAGVMANIRRPHLWTRKTVDEIMRTGCCLFSKSLTKLGYEFRPGEDVLHPLQVLKNFVLGVNFVRFDLQSMYSGKLESKYPQEMNAELGLEKFFEQHKYGILWSAPHAVAIWRMPGAPGFYMMEPHACNRKGLRISPQDEDGAACVMTFTSAKLLSHAYLQNLPLRERPQHDFTLYVLTVSVSPIQPLGQGDPPLVLPPPGAPKGYMNVPATSKVDVYGKKRVMSGQVRRAEVTKTSDLFIKYDKEDKILKGVRNSKGWLVLTDGSQFLSATHSMACKRYPYGSRGNQALACSVMAVAESAVQEVCAWSTADLDHVLDSGDQLYQDSYLHYRPPGTPILSIQQILRKFYTPGNCVCRVVVYEARQSGSLDKDLAEKLKQFFREERKGVLVAHGGEFAVALFRTQRGFYMFDPSDRDRYGRAVPPHLVGHARACFSQFGTVQALADKLKQNVPLVPTKQQLAPEVKEIKPAKKEGSQEQDLDKKTSQTQVRFSPGDDKKGKPKQDDFYIYGMDVTSLRTLNKHER